MEQVVQELKDRENMAYQFGWKARFVDVMQELKSKANKQDEPVLCIVEEYSNEKKPLKTKWFWF